MASTKRSGTELCPAAGFEQVPIETTRLHRPLLAAVRQSNRFGGGLLWLIHHTW
jgi:hypothetical protein